MTYPAFQVALNKDLVKDEKRQQVAMRVLNTMLSEGAQKTIGSRSDVISYSRNAKLSISPLLEDIKPLIDANRLYVRLASTDFFAASKLAVSQMVQGKATAAQAYTIMDEYLKQSKDKEATNLHPCCTVNISTCISTCLVCIRIKRNCVCLVNKTFFIDFICAATECE